MSSVFPHEDVWARLGVSQIHGIGVFAIKPIPAGTDVFANDEAPLVWIEVSELEQASLSGKERELYRDFSVRCAGKLGCPANFNLLSVGWYLNEPPAGDAANIIATEDFRMIARRPIAMDEELTVKYDTFSERSAYP